MQFAPRNRKNGFLINFALNATKIFPLSVAICFHFPHIEAVLAVASYANAPVVIIAFFSRTVAVIHNDELLQMEWYAMHLIL